MDNENYMERAIALARKGQDNVWPNPMVGAIVVSREGEILGEGYHEKFGQAHAEVNALKAVKNQENIAGSTMYVTLEPCSHYGKTPPCADLIIKNKISKVVVGSIDPNPKVAGTGIEKLRKAGIEVIVGVMENECKEINPQFFTIYEKKRPYIILKWAQSSDAFLDIVREKGTKPAWLTGEEGRQMVHKW
ncbi:MAG: bifunctional diaminohydroxyphosphoribosylaminopyrimidine deaminase/5-amino-6-(5-phosphoribosylamino)uracil reductase RibD, partial [Mucinivorans sp.]